MKTEMDVLRRLKETIETQLNNFITNESIVGKIDKNNVVIDFPDVDNMPRNTMFYIEPESEQIENLTVCSDQAQMGATVYIMLKKDKHETLIEKVFEYFNYLYCLLRSNQDLDSFIDFLEITNMEYFPAVTASNTIVAIEATLALQWSKDFGDVC